MALSPSYPPLSASRQPLRAAGGPSVLAPFLAPVPRCLLALWLKPMQHVSSHLPPHSKPHLQKQPIMVRPVVYNRLGAVIPHVPWYGFRAQPRLAKDCGYSESTISRLLRGECMPSLMLALKVTRALERRLQRHLDLSELFSVDASYPTASVCELVGCPGCLPDAFYSRSGAMKRRFKHVRSGRWSISQPHNVLTAIGDTHVEMTHLDETKCTKTPRTKTPRTKTPSTKASKKGGQ